ncbi:hypothetical protein SUDANB58_05770 (plasmid) [Streptomyces sp. enrichment culture]|uniref:DUF2637 domain-containing protein n=1 Tax=Streptomyces sp. enrichment culture TaxID=1795815 RepID=UPI003F56EEEB
MTTAHLPLTKPPTAPASPPAVPVSPAPAAVSPPPVSVSPAPRDRSALAWRALAVVAVLGAVAVAGIGFAGSYSALRALAVDKGFGDFAPAFPIGVDAGIIVALALDLYLARRGLSWPFLRPVAHGLTLATVYFNANAGEHSPAEDPVAAAMHAVMPVLFVVAVEAARYLVIRTSGLAHGTRPDGVPLHRWVLAPWPTWRLYRRMRVWGLTSYTEAVDRDQELRVYQVMLERRYGSVRKAPSDARLPLTMARYGLTVDEALALPQEAAEREQRRREAAEARKVAEQVRAAERAAELEAARLRAAGLVDAARHEVTASTGAAEARARATVTAVERSAALETEALESAAAAEADARKAAAERAAAEDRKAAAETAAAAAEIERSARETEQAAREAEARAAEAEARTADAEARKAAAERATAENRKAAAEAAAAAAEIELRAAEAEDLARLSPRERTVRKLARIILAEHAGDADRMPLDAISDAFNVATGTASQYRQEAARLIHDGYRG